MNNLKAIVAVCDDWGIGANGDMVVSNRADMRHFVSCTKGHTVIMGRKTLESFPGAHPLKDRRNIVLTRDPLFLCRGAEVVHTIEEALAPSDRKKAEAAKPNARPKESSPVRVPHRQRARSL